MKRKKLETQIRQERELTSPRRVVHQIQKTLEREIPIITDEGEGSHHCDSGDERPQATMQGLLAMVVMSDEKDRRWLCD